MRNAKRLLAGAIIALGMEAALAQTPAPTPPITFNVATAEELSSALTSAYLNSLASTTTVTTITLTSSITGTQQMIVNANVVINGGGYTLDMNQADRAFFVAGGNVSFTDLTISGGVARGGTGAGGGGGGAGLGGAIFVGSGTYEAYDKTTAASGISAPVVTLNGVNFSGNTAIGGSTTYSQNGMNGGGGGMGGNGGNGTALSNGDGGGGGFGVSANGGDGGPYNADGGSGGPGAFLNITGASTSGGSGGNGSSSNGGAGGPNGGGGGGGGGGTPEGTGGGGGLGGERGYYANNVTPNNGGYGGFGGGGGGVNNYEGGNGGFGGGGGASAAITGYSAGNGGFGGGGGSATGGSAGNGGFGAGNGQIAMYGTGGGGLGAGGAIFVMKGGSLVINDATFTGNEAQAGSGVNNGSATGNDIFLGENIVVDTTSSISVNALGGAGNTSDPNISSHATDENAQGGVIKKGTGTLTLTGTSYYSGQTVINKGVLALAAGAREFGTAGTVLGQNSDDVATLLLGSGSTYAHGTASTPLQIAQAAGSTGQVVIGSGGQSNGAYVGVNVFNGGSGNASVSFQQMYGPAGQAQYEFYTTLTGSIQVIQDGPGTTVLDPQYGANTYSGGTVVKQGILVAAGTYSLGMGTVTVNGSGTLSVASGATVEGNGAITLSDSGSLSLASGSVLKYTEVVTLTGNSSMMLASDASVTGIDGLVVGVNAGDNAVVQFWSGNTYRATPHSSIAVAQNAGSTGQIIIGSGGTSTGTVMEVSSIGGGAGNATLSFQHGQDNYEIYTNLTGSLQVIQNGPGTTVLKGTGNSYTGGTLVQSGTLVVGARGALGQGEVLVTGGTLSDPDQIITRQVSLAGGEFTVGTFANGMYRNLATATSAFNDGRATMASLLDGTVGEASTLVTSFATTSTAWNDWMRQSDVYNFTGTGGDVIVLQLSLASLTDSAFLAWLDPGSGQWVNATDNNIRSNALIDQQDYQGSFLSFQGEFFMYTLDQYIGAWGVDAEAGTVWAVLDNADNSQFAVAPEPSTSALLLAAAGLAVVMTLRRRARKMALR